VTTAIPQLNQAFFGRRKSSQNS